MDGVHDLGGREGFGPIVGKDDERPFHGEWETRAFGVTQAAARGRGWTIDWFRYCRELAVPVDYLTRPYFDQWITGLAARMADEGYLTLDEIKSGASTFVPKPASPAGTTEAARAFVATPLKFTLEPGVTARFAPGDEVRCRLDGHPGHTRMPAYVRGREGIIHARHGGHIFPDASARGEQRGEHLYTVSFAATSLWPEATGRGDRVLVDLWESYLEPA
jgi:nitrile hydratase